MKRLRTTETILSLSLFALLLMPTTASAEPDLGGYQADLDDLRQQVTALKQRVKQARSVDLLAIADAPSATLAFGLDRVPPGLEIVKVEYLLDGRLIRVDELDSKAGRLAAAEQKDAQHRLNAGEHVLSVVVTARPRRLELADSFEGLTITVRSERTFKANQGGLTRLGVIAMDPLPGEDIAQRLRLRIDVAAR